MAERFVLLRIGNMRGLDLSLFDFDYDLTWAALMFAADGNVLGRFGGRDADTPGKYHSLAGLRYALEQSWERFERGAPPSPRPAASGKRIEDYAGAQRFSAKACFHCHNVHEFRREEQQAAGIWRKDHVWVYPEPAALGLTMEIEQGNKVRDVRAGGPAASAGMKPGDVIRMLNHHAVASVADVQYALHRAPAAGSIAVHWRRGGQEHDAKLALAAGWRESDVSWRWSLKSMKPDPQVHGEDLSAADKATLGLDPRRLAFRQGSFVPRAAQQAGIRIGDIIIGVDGKQLDMNARQFETFIRLNYQVGDEVRHDIIRGGERLKIAVKLPG
ncbi:MAG: PDZ domain-containing protein [Gemmataceae bacterium]|nr:PDZ domain-containing protein [Gemmataceae bacterium]